MSQLQAQIKTDPTNQTLIDAKVKEITKLVLDADVDITKGYITPRDPQKKYQSSPPPASILERIDQMFQSQSQILKLESSDGVPVHTEAYAVMKTQLIGATISPPHPNEIFGAKRQTEVRYHQQLSQLQFESYYPTEAAPSTTPIFNKSQREDQQEHWITTEIKDQRLATESTYAIYM